MNAHPTVTAQQLFSELLSASDQHLVLCGSARVARRIKARLAQQALAQGLRAWPGAQIHTPTGWLDLEYARARRASLLGATAPPKALSHTEAELIWEQSLGPLDDNQALLRPLELARLAQRTHQLVELWCLDLCGADNADLAQWRPWAQRYRQRLQTLGALDLPGRIDWLEQQLRAREQLPQLTLVACEALPPRWLRLLERLHHETRPIRSLAPAAGAHDRGKARRFERFEDECHSAMQWAQQQAGNGKRVGVVVPGLDQRRLSVERIADAWLNPQVLAPGGADRDRHYNLSGGWPLARQALVHTALQLLRWACAPLEVSEAGAVLRSRYWLGRDSLTARAQLDRRMRQRHLQRVGRRQLLALAGGTQADEPHGYLRPLADAQWPSGKQDAETWAQCFRHYLGGIGWPGQQQLGSRDYQARERLHELFNEFASLAPLLGPIAGHEAVARLAQLAEATLFQPETERSLIEILDWGEAQGLDFDAVWLLGMDDAHCPPADTLNPIVPFSLQHQAGVPAANPQVRTQLAQHQLQQWCSGTDVVASCAALDGDAELRPARITSHYFSWPEHCETAPADPLYRVMAQAQPLEAIADYKAPAFGGQIEAPGGSRLLGDQAACPFRAFGHHRLQASELPQAEDGVPAALRGQILHQALESFWLDVRDQATLLELDDTQRRQRLAPHIQAALAAAKGKAPALEEFWWQAEAQRCAQLIDGLLQLETQRPDFQVLANETQVPLQIGPLQLQLRPDRMDQVGKHRLVLDYKTGRQLPRPWAEERPEEPQLLAYALTDTKIDGLAFAQLAAGKLGFQGIAATADLAEGIQTPEQLRGLPEQAPRQWADFRAHWQQTLLELAEEFASGVAAVAPTRGAQTCRYCDLQSLCRIGDAAAEDADTAEANS